MITTPVIASTDERFARLFQALEGYEARHAADHITEVPPLVSIERAHEIRQFHIALAELQHKHGVRLQCFESDCGSIAVVDTRSELPAGYCSALICHDGSLEVISWAE